jgi:hypothetical protein
VKRAGQLRREQLAAYPDSAGGADWAFARAADPAEATRIARVVLGDKRREVQRHLGQVLAPLSASAALNESWVLRMAGKSTEADAVLAATAKRGVPLPEGK